MLALAVLVGVVGSTTAEDLSSLIDRASQARAAGDWATAASLLERAYAIHPAPEILYNRARAAEAMDDLIEAQKLYTKLQLHPEVAPEIRDRSAERARSLGELIHVALVRLDGDGVEIDGKSSPKGLVPLDQPEAIASVTKEDEAHLLVLSLSVGHVAHVVAAAVLDATSACLDLGGARLEALDDHPVGVTSKSVCVAAGEHTLAIAGRAGVRVALVRGNINALPHAEAERGAPIRTIALFSSGGAALIGGVVATLIAGSDRETVTGAQKDDGKITGISQQDAFAARDSANRAAMWGLTLLIAGAIIAAGGALSLGLDH